MHVYFRLGLAAVACVLFLDTPGSAQPPIGGLQSLPFIMDAESRSISAENPTGEKGKGGMAIPDPSEPPEETAASGRAADDLGQGWKVKPFLRVNAGKTVTLMDVDGPGIIQHIWMVEQLSRDHILRFYWDDETEPSIDVPAPDFFAVGHEIFGEVNSLAVIVNPANALNCYWPMPFRSHARVTFSNEGKEDLVLLAYQIDYVLTEVPENTGYFHAQWRRANTADQNPYVILDGVEGRGQYVGTFISWTQTEPGWWGEGEIKFYIDGDDQFPTICGTGTEDYFCGSYGFAHSYTTAYVGTTLPTKDDSALPNHWSLYRWHIPDPIHFKKDLRVDIQALGWYPEGKYKRLSDDVCSVAYWYQAEPHAPFPKLPPAEQRRPILTLLDLKGGGIEGESLQVKSKSAGEVSMQDLRSLNGAWSGGEQLWWTGVTPGATLSLAFAVETAGRYAVSGRFTNAADYGIVKLSIDEQTVVERLDLYAPKPVPGSEVVLGTHEFEAGDHAFGVEVTGANEKADKRYLVGLDYFRLESVD